MEENTENTENPENPENPYISRPRAPSVEGLELGDKSRVVLGEETPLIQDLSSLYEKKQNLVGEIYDGALYPSKKQAFASLIALGASGYLAYSTGPSFFHYALLGRHDVPGIQSINSALSPDATEWVNIVLNFYVLMLVFYRVCIQYPNDYLLKKKVGLKTHLLRDALIMIPTTVYTLFSAFPFGALTLYSGSIFNFIRQLLVFSSMFGLGSYVVVSFLAFNVIQRMCQCNKKSKEPEDTSLEENIAKLDSKPVLLLEAYKMRSDDNDEKRDEKQKLLDTISTAAEEPEEAASTKSACEVGTRKIIDAGALLGLMFTLAVGTWGYFHLTKGDGLTAMSKWFDIKNLSKAARWALGVASFLPLYGYAFFSNLDTERSMINMSEETAKSCIKREQRPTQRWSHWLYPVGAALVLLTFAGYFFGYLSGGAAIALNAEKAGLTAPWSKVVTSLGASVFNGYGFFGISRLLYWVATLGLAYPKGERNIALYTGQANSFFERHKGDLVVEPGSQKGLSKA